MTITVYRCTYGNDTLLKHFSFDFRATGCRSEIVFLVKQAWQILRFRT